jgi:hypothetical protein
MPKMSSGDLRALLAAERADALSAMSASKLAEERAAALDCYLGDMVRDMPAPGGEELERAALETARDPSRLFEGFREIEQNQMVRICLTVSRPSAVRRRDTSGTRCRSRDAASQGAETA